MSVFIIFTWHYTGTLSQENKAIKTIPGFTLYEKMMVIKTYTWK